MDLKNKKIMAVGLAKSGISAAKLCLQSGAHVTVYDGKKEEALVDQLEQLKGGDYAFILGREPQPEELAQLDYMILSPGVPTDLSFIVKAKELGVKIWGEVELGYGFCKSPLIGITGTNGKTTTTTLVGEIMKAYKADSLVAGNIGTPFTEVAQQSKEDGFVTIELSSFQLETIEAFRPRVSAILNFTPDHLDRHKTFENYVAAKCRVYENQTAEDVCVLNYDDELCRRQGLTLMEQENAPQVVFFSHKTATKGGLWTEGDRILMDVDGEACCMAEISKMKIFGPHNEENAMAAIACAAKAGVPAEIIREQLYAFKGVAHRIEDVGCVNGVNYYNDSKATNPDAAIKGLLAMRSQTVLIGGGYDKGTPYDDWCKLFEGRVRQLILLGQTRQDIYDCAVKCGYPAENIYMAETFEEAVSVAAQSAKEGDSVLLSPACASWGMFKSYEQRGDIFRTLVQNMMK